MALWQYSFYVLPRESINYLVSDDFKNNTEFDDEFFWKDYHYTVDLFERINKILPLNKSWSKNIRLFGDQESNCLEVLSEGEVILSISLRVDFRSNYGDVLSELINFFIYEGMILLDENLNIIPLMLESLRSVIENSPQIKKYKKLSRS